MKIGIIGAGATGLAAAFDLCADGHEVTLFEAGAEVGGLAAGFRVEGWDWSLEKFYHHWFATDTDILGLIEEIGKSEKVVFRSPMTSLWHPTGIYPMDAPIAGSALLGRFLNIMRLPDINPIAKFRLGFVGLLLSMIPDGLYLEKHTADEWSEKWVGKAAHNLLWRPMLIGKFGALYQRINMAWLWARIYKRTSALGTYEGGFQAMLEDLATAVQKRGATLHLNNPVQAVEATDGGGITLTIAGVPKHFDVVLATTGPGLLARLAPGLPEAYKAQLTGLTSLGATIVILALDRQLMQDGTYWLNLPATSPERDQNPFPFLALVEHTNYMDKDHYGGDHIIYCGDYLPLDHPNFTMSDEDLAALYIGALTKANPDFSPEWIQRRWVFRAPYAQPAPFVNHSQAIPDIQTPIPGLYLASMSQVYPWDRGTNYAVELGRNVAKMINNQS